MNQTLPIPNSVKIRQNIAAWLLVLTDIFSIVITIFMMFGENINTSVYQPAVYLLAWVLLCSTASNKATRIASILILASTLISVVLSLFAMPESIDMMQILYVYLMIKPLISIYAYSIILRGNSNLNANDRSWIGFLIVCGIGLFVIQLFSVGYRIVLVDYDIEFQMHYLFSIGFGWRLWSIIYCILVLIAEFRLSKSLAFAGNYVSGPAPKGTYSPFNRYFVATFITLLVVLGALYLIYTNLESIENIF